MELPLYTIGALLLTVLLMRGLIPIAASMGLMDRPGGRKDHQNEVPLVGGIAMFLAFFGMVGVFPELPSYWNALLFASLIIVAVGIVDDRHSLSPHARFIAQIAAALTLGYGGSAVVSNLGNLLFFGTIGLGFLAVPFTVFGAVGFMNAMNMADGMDGLAGGLALVAVLAMTHLAWSAGLAQEMSLLLVLAAVLIGFLAFNARTPWRVRARIFMGDAGSMFLGLLLMCLLIRLSQGKNPAMAPVTALWLVALPLMDTISVMLRRIKKGRSPFEADRQHFHHILQLAGYSVGQAVSIILGLALVLAMIGVAGVRYGIPEGVMFIGFLLLFGGYFWATTHAWKVMRLIRSV
jgi:UDP-GlcNAc:undecaprenyl-phosphate/decaprenyl-phosphate GlcNAc-1-phosphate transferase